MTTQFLHGNETVEVGSATQPVQINKSGVIYAAVTAPDADNSIFPINQPVLLTSQPRKALALGVNGTGLSTVKQAYQEGAGAVIVNRVPTSTNPDTQLSYIIGDQAAKTGIYGALACRALLGVAPRTIIAPGFMNRRVANAANPVVSAALPVARKLRGRVYSDAPSTGHDDAIAYREDFDSDRLLIMYPNGLIWDDVTSSYVARPLSASMAGLTARVHRDLGFWFSPSNQVLNSVGGLSTPIDWGLSDPDSEANILNENRITTVVNMGSAAGLQAGGWRRWGNRNCASDANWMFESVRTSLDMVYEALDEATLWATDKPPSEQLLRDVTERANAFFKFGKKTGFLVGGRCWLDPELNPKQQLSAGVWNWSIDPEAPAPMEHIIYTANRNADYYTQEVAALANMISIG